MCRFKKLFLKNLEAIKHNQGTFKLLIIIVFFMIFRKQIDSTVTNYFSELSLIQFSIIYFFLALFLLPTLPMTLVASSLYSPLIAAIYIAFTITLVGLIQFNFPRSFGLGIKDDRYISHIAKNVSLKSRLDKFNFLLLVRNIPVIPLAVSSAFAIKVLDTNSKINLLLFLSAYFLGSLSITFLAIKIVTI